MKNRTLVIGDKTILVSKEDFYLVKEHKWWLKDGLYACTKIKGKNKYLHRLILGEGDYICDHINQNPLDNRRSNLRKSDKSKNAINSKNRSDNTSGMKGISFDKEKNKWHVYINKEKKRYFIGYFKELKEAVKARIRTERELFKTYRNEKFKQ